MPRALLQRSTCLASQSVPYHLLTRSLSAAGARGQERDEAGAHEGEQGGSGGQVRSKRKTMAELDEELKAKLAQMSDGGGEAGVEFEDGKPVAMKKAVRSEMFRIMPFRGK